MNYRDVANSELMFLLCFLVILAVTIQAVLFIRKAWKRGAELGIEPALMKKAMLNSAVFSVVPSLPILVMLMVLTTNLGKYFPWLRLSVVGSAAYENMAADMVAKSFGLEGISDPGFDMRAFTIAMWVMTAGIIWGIVFNIFFMKRLDKFSQKAKASNNNFVPVVSASLFIGMLSLMSAPYLTNIQNTPAIVSFITAAVVVVICGHAAKSTKIRAIDEFSLPISLLAGMTAAILLAM